jgi:hypothetical protein
MTDQTSSKRTSIRENQVASGHPLSLENRRQTEKRIVPGGEGHRWLPGQSGNPGGRPRTGALTKACRELMEQTVPGDPAGRTYAQAIAERLADLSLKGHLSAIRELGDRAEGRAGQLLSLEISPGSNDGAALTLDGIEVLPAESRSIDAEMEVRPAETDRLLLP